MGSRRKEVVMGDQKKSLFSERISAGRRTYFVDICETDEKKKYLSICESQPDGKDQFKRNRVLVFEETLIPFQEALKKAFDFAVKN